MRRWIHPEAQRDDARPCPRRRGIRTSRLSSPQCPVSCLLFRWSSAWVAIGLALAALPFVAHADAGALLARFECSRCHAGTGLTDPPPEKRCVGCHRDILAGRFAAPRAAVRRWQQHLQSLRVAPSLAGAGRLRRDWLARFLLSPHDVRPNLPASMPRLPLPPAEAEALARHLAANEAPDDTFADADISRGRALYAQLGCGSCHVFSGAGLPTPAAPTPVPDAVALAPDLRHARTRLQSGRLVALLADPRAVMPGTAMPAVVLAAPDVRA